MSQDFACKKQTALRFIWYRDYVWLSFNYSLFITFGPEFREIIICFHPEMIQHL